MVHTKLLEWIMQASSEAHASWLRSVQWARKEKSNHHNKFREGKVNKINLEKIGNR
jgi:poly(3-hydroxyalkanoate) synthetase